jgi:Cu(I)/Ag(I) efflux system membrane fusion protein
MSPRKAVLLVAVAACSQGAPEPADHTPAAKAPDPHAGHDMADMPGAVPAGQAEVVLAPDRQQRIGLTLGKAERTSVGGTILATGVVRTDERREAHIHPKLMGWVEKVFVSAEGQRVRRGQPLYSIYSQELLVAQQDYLRARKASPDLAQASRDRLRLLDIPEDEIRRIEESGAARALTIRAPLTGTVLAKSILPGQYVGPEMQLYWIADLSRVWIIADVYEYELGHVDRNGTARIQVVGMDRELEAKVDYVYPTVDTATRTVKVRLVVANPKGELRPGNFATVSLPTGSLDILSVAEEAIIDTGMRQVVFVHLGGGRFRPALVQVGRRSGGRAEIRAGLRDGAEVVVSGQFLLDSESRLRAGGARAQHGGH